MEKTHVVRQFDPFDGWFDVFGPATERECDAWIKASGKGTQTDTKYIKKFPANTTMLNWGYDNGI